jgi:hypothetical protein
MGLTSCSLKRIPGSGGQSKGLKILIHTKFQEYEDGHPSPNQKESEAGKRAGDSGKFHDQEDAKRIVIRRQLRGHNDTPFGRPTPGRPIGRPAVGRP